MSNCKLITEEEVVDGVTYTKKYIRLKNDETNKSDYVRRVLAQNPNISNADFYNLIESLYRSD